jgi:hypothetical protein
MSATTGAGIPRKNTSIATTGNADVISRTNLFLFFNGNLPFGKKSPGRATDRE